MQHECRISFGPWVDVRDTTHWYLCAFLLTVQNTYLVTVT